MMSTTELLRRYAREPYIVLFFAVVCVVCVFLILFEDNSLIGFALFIAASMLGYAAGLNG